MGGVCKYSNKMKKYSQWNYTGTTYESGLEQEYVY